jgi:hypothetical protein
MSGKVSILATMICAVKRKGEEKHSVAFLNVKKKKETSF